MLFLLDFLHLSIILKEPLHFLIGLGLCVATGPEPTGSLESEETDNISDDNEDAEGSEGRSGAF